MLKLVGRYEVQARIGEGAMADVYRAYDPGINRVLAIKVLKAEFRQNRHYVARFLREAKAAGALSHPNIVTIYDVGEVDGYPYIAMELLDGEPLDKAAARIGRLPVDDVLAIGAQLGEALRYAHEVGVVHRDIKPSNILLAPDGRGVKILDFGIARVAEADTEAEMLKTQVGQVLGTPRYMSPEQALGGHIDGRSDLFSVGVVLYELITGQRAFAGTSAATLALQITQHDPRPIAELAPDCPRGLQFIVGKLLAKKPERRFADGGQLAEAMRREQRALEALAEEQEGVRRYLPLQARLTLIMAGITAVVLLVCVGLVLNRQDKAMERMTLSSGAAIASFVASNAALTAADNATLPQDQRDWAPVSAFVRAASADPNIRQITVVDADGLIRGATDATQVGQIYETPRGETLVQKGSNAVVTSIKPEKGVGGFRFVRPILYAGRSFGTVDVAVSTADLEAAASLSHWLLAALSAVTLGVVVAVSYAAARQVAGPIRRLRAALADAVRGDLDFRISHNRKDEFGELFDGFNRFAASVQDRLETEALVHEDPTPGEPSAMTELRIAAAAAERAVQALDRTRLVMEEDETDRTIIGGRS
ncbi:protein kinase [Phenylobacterium sp.]|uniref:protein kinase domain-containing protein n=1 Tax=Phenylobacterium sp. TaxID=1871053 RepID=UPI0027338B2D|nr:protein kinase [Phenylobacterium sp.]MDP3854189.1 protein kinase [Phenylobacterium sp.]